MDKNKLFLGGFYVLLLSLAALYGWFTTFRLTAERYLEKAESIFNQAVENDMDRREKELGNTYRFVYIPGEEDRAAKVETADTSFFLPKGDIYQHKSRQAKNSDIIQLYLLEENPIRVNKLDSLYRVLLEENDIFAQTALVYITEEETIYSCVDSSFYTSAYKMKEREIGINGEIILRPFVQFKSGCLIAGSPDMYLLIGCFWGIAVALLSWYFFFWRKKTATVSFSEFPSLAVVSASDPYAKLAEELMFDPAAGTFDDWFARFMRLAATLFNLPQSYFSQIADFQFGTYFHCPEHSCYCRKNQVLSALYTGYLCSLHSQHFVQLLLHELFGLLPYSYFLESKYAFLISSAFAISF